MELLLLAMGRDFGSTSGSAPLRKKEEVDLRALLSMPLIVGPVASRERSALNEFCRGRGLPEPCERLLGLRLAVLPLMLVSAGPAEL